MRKKNTEQQISEEVLSAEYEAVYRFVSYEKFEGNSSLYTWLCSIAKNLWLNNCKKYSREVLPETMLGLENGNQIPFEQNLVEKETALYIHRILHNMQEPYKEVLTKGKQKEIFH